MMTLRINKRMISTLALLLAVGTVRADPEISQSTIGSSASSVVYGAARNSLDGNLATFWCSAHSTTVPHWLRLELNARYGVTQLDYWGRQDYQNGRISNYEIYVTDSPSTNKVDWGVAVATGTFANITNQQTVTFGRTVGRYVILYALTTPTGYAGAAEVRLYGIENADPSPVVQALTLNNPVRNTSLFTVGDVDATITAISGDGAGAGAVTHYGVTETDAAPASDWAEWSATLPIRYTLTGTARTATLYGWAKDADSNVSALSSATSRSIHFDPDAPTISVPVTNAPYGSQHMLVTWSASPAAFARVAWRPVGSAVWSYTTWNATAALQFSHLPSGLTMGAAYEVMAQLNDVDLSTVQYEHLPGLRELPRTAAYATAAQWGAAANAIDNGIDNFWATGGNAFLRIDMGETRTVSTLKLAYLGRRDLINGRIKDYEVYVNNMPLTAIGELAGGAVKVAEGQFVNTDSYGNAPVQHVEIRNVSGRYVYLLSITDFNGFAGAGEVWLYERPIRGTIILIQ